MTEPSKLLKVFLCHAKEDKAVVRELYQQLRAEKWIDPWLDSEKLLPGQDWDMEIEKAVEASHIILVCISNHSVSKEGYIQKELRLVLDIALTMPEETIFAIPLRLEECQVPRRLRIWQWVDYFPPASRTAAYARLLDSLKLRAQKLGLATGSAPAVFDDPSPTPTEPPSPTRALRKAAAPATPAAPTLDLYIPPEYAGEGFTPPPATVPIWTFGGLEFVKVPRGEFLMGSQDDNKLAWERETPQHKVNIPYDFLLARFPVTNQQFQTFVRAAAYQTRAQKEGFGWVWNGNEWVETKGADWSHPRGPQGGLERLLNHPVVQVAWEDVLEYCSWLNRQYRNNTPRGLVFRPPTEAEWEKAARGADGREWPWGDEFDPACCNSNESGLRRTTPVGVYSLQGDSPHGLCDMAGNVWEWTASLWGADSQAPTYKYPYNPRDGRETLKADDSIYRVCRGGSFDNDLRGVRAACRYGSLAGYRFEDVGFRVALAPHLS